MSVPGVQGAQIGVASLNGGDVKLYGINLVLRASGIACPPN